MTKRSISGIQPTSDLHIGNYLGAIKSWLSFVESGYDAFAFIADLHAITVFQDPKQLKESTVSLAAMYVACGLDIEKCPIFVQSSIPEHAELGWILGCFTSSGWLNRMTQYKEKSAKYKESSSLGLYSYPVLQAADILLYQVDEVPVGEDQKQHIELTRDIAESFNRQTNSSVLKLPSHVIPKESARIMSLRDGTSKMSKSDESDYSRINLNDSADLIQLKFKKAKSDSIKEVYFDKENRPEISNLMNIYAAFSAESIKSIEQKYKSQYTGQFKSDLADLVVETLRPISEEYKKLMQNKDYINVILNNGRERAAPIAQKTLREVKEKVGLI